MPNLRRFPKLITLLSAAVLLVIGSTFDWWYQKRLDSLAEEQTMPKWMTDIANWTEYLTHPYVLGFLFGGLVFSFPEWWPFIKKYMHIGMHHISNWRDEPIRDQKLSIAWNHYNPDELNVSSVGTYCQFHCFTMADGKCQCGPGMTSIEKLKRSAVNEYHVHKLILKNHGDTPIFKVSIPIKIECCLKYKDSKDYKIIDTVESRMFAIENESIMPGQSITFYLHNVSDEEYLLVIHLLGYVDANLFNEEKQVKIKYTWETFKPLFISLSRDE